MLCHVGHSSRLIFHVYNKTYLLTCVITIVSGKGASLSHSASRSLLMRPTSPKSPVASVFESVEASDDEEDFTDNSKLDPTYLDTNGDAVS